MTNLKELVTEFGKTFKDDSIVKVGVEFEDPERIPTGLFAFDLATGGGFPEGRISLVYGTEDSMKTSLCLKAIASAQRKYKDRTPVFVDVEGVFSKSWAKALGVDLDRLVYIHPDNAEQLVDIIEGVLYTDDVSVVVIDSLAALVTQQELEKSAEEAIVGRTGLVINKLYRKVSRALGKCQREGRNPTLICINQIRYKIGVMHGNPETMPGGPAFLFASSMTIRFYGKDIMESAVSKTLPAYKEVNMIIKKHKVPILAKKGVVQIALQPIPEYGLDIGQAYDWNTLLAYLKSMELLVKSDKKGWDFTHPGTGEVTTYKKQDDLKEQIYADPAFGQEIKSALISAMMQTDEVIE